MWRSAFPEYPQVSVLRIINIDHRATECLTSVLDVSWVHAECHFAVVQKECATPSNAHPTSRYITVHDQFSRPSFVLQLQATNAGVIRPGYEASYYMFSTWMKIFRLKHSVLTCADYAVK